jgi:hypothetical protein
MGINKKLLTSSKEEILQALAPLNQHVLDNRERFLKALTQRDYVIDEDGRIRWSPFLLSGKIKKVDKVIADKFNEVDLIYKSKEFMDKIDYSPVQFQLEIKEFCDGFQVDLSVRKDISVDQKDEAALDSTSYFVWKSC